MITLKTLPHATAQAVFDQIATHMLTQGVRSAERLNNEAYSCRYRFASLRCAAGCLIADDEYHDSMEGQSWNRLVNNGLVSEAHAELIVSCQSVHDNAEPELWQERLAAIALSFNLKMPTMEVANDTSEPQT